jgi:hypothetical protein
MLHAMRNGRFVFRLLLALAAPCAGVAAAGPEHSDPVLRDVRTLVEAGYRGDVETMMRHAHPALVERLGGRAAAQAAMEKVLGEAARAEVGLVSLTFPAAPEFLAGNGRRFAIVRTLSVIRGRDGERLESLNYLLGVRERGSQGWAWLEGSMIDGRGVRLLFPDFPDDYELPPFHRRKL